MHFNAEFIRHVCPAAVVQGSISEISNFSVDSRQIKQGDIFVAISGTSFDGHDFIQEALSKGAAGFIANAAYREKILNQCVGLLSDKFILFVSDTYQALIDLASAWRQQFHFPVIAVTGSVGKTTTKEMIRSILKQAEWPGVVSYGNQNTLVGISLNILKMKAADQVAVFELGIGQVGSMKKLVELLQPTCAVITHVGHSHILGLGNIASIAREKRDIFSLFGEKNIGIVNGDQVILNNISYSHPVIKFGLKKKNHIQGKKITIVNNAISFLLKIYKKQYVVMLQSCNKARVYNALAAITVGKVLGIPDEVLIRGVELVSGIDGRFAFNTHSSGSVMINDAYNSNPESIKAALQAFADYQTSLPKVLVLADMLELADQAVYWHRFVGRCIAKMQNIDTVFLIGTSMREAEKNISKSIKIYKFETASQAENLLRSMMNTKPYAFLFKGSRSTGLSVLADQLQQVK